MAGAAGAARGAAAAGAGGAARAAATAAAAAGPFFLDAFALRQWDDPAYQGPRLAHVPKQSFVERVAAAGGALVGGYAPFCKHVFVPNFCGLRVGVLDVGEQNRGLVRSGYLRRKEGELPVLSRWFDAGEVGELPEAKMLDVILYSREQIVLERAAQEGLSAAEAEAVVPPEPWGIISIKAQDEPFETPMQPITMMRNALGRAEGGSGVPLDREKYEESVKYWENRAPVV